MTYDLFMSPVLVQMIVGGLFKTLAECGTFSQKGCGKYLEITT